MPEPLPGSNVRRLVDVMIPRRILIPPVALNAPDPETVPVPPPDEEQQLAVSLFMEPAPTEPKMWPGKISMGTLYVGQMTLYNGDRPVGHFTAVASYWPESETAVLFSKGRITAVPGVDVPMSPRVVLFQYGEANGVGVPSLTEMPFGHLAEPRAHSDRTSSPRST